MSPHVSTADAHHTRYADSEAISAINTDADHGSTAAHNYFSGSHADLTNVGASDHHTRFAASEVDSTNWSDYEIQKDGVDGTGVINFKTV
jgi:hypothetical protein